LSEVTTNGSNEAVEGDWAIFERSGNGVAAKAKSDAKLLVMNGEPMPNQSSAAARS
jgi:hypothetical protein